MKKHLQFSVLENGIVRIVNEFEEQLIMTVSFCFPPSQRKTKNFATSASLR